MTTPDVAQDTGRDDWQRLHPLSPLLRGGFAFILVVGLIIANLQDRLVSFFLADDPWDLGRVLEVTSAPFFDVDFLVERNLLSIAVGVLVGIVLLSLVFAWASWRFLSYRITVDVVETRSGVVFRKHRRAPIERIQSVAVQRPLVARLFGLAKVQIETAGQTGTVDLAYLGYDEAKSVRERILRRAQQSRAVATRPSPQDAMGAHLRNVLDQDVHRGEHVPKALITVPIGRLVASVALNSSVLAILLVLVAVFVIVPVLGLSALIAIVIMVAVVFGVAISRVNRGFRFTLSRGEDEVRVGAGLTATSTETIPLRRIHALEIRQPVWWRPFGWWMMRLTIAGSSRSQEDAVSVKNVALPVGTEQDVVRAFNALFPGIASSSEGMAKLRDGLAGSGEGYQGSGPRSAWILLLGKRRAGISLLTDSAGLLQQPSLWIRRGALNRSLSIMPIARVQSIELGRSVPHRLFGLSSLEAHIVKGSVTMRMRGIERFIAQELFDRLSFDVIQAQQSERGSSPSA